MKISARYSFIPILFSFLAVSFVMFTGNHNQANFLGLFIGSTLFYSAPFFILRYIFSVSSAKSKYIHSGYIGATIALTLIASFWLLPRDPSGLPMQWMAYYPLSLVLVLIFLGAALIHDKFIHS
ncbi:MAG: putative membrane protein [Oleispira sp.]